MPDNRPAPVRLTKKSLYILESLKAANSGNINKAQIIESALCKEYLLLSKIWENENK